MTMPAIPLSELAAQAPFLRRLARALVQDEHAAADLVQETWVAALRHGPREGEEARGWLARLLRDRARSHRRGAARRGERERDAGALRAGGGADGGTQVAERVLAAVLALDEPARALILRRYYEDLAPSAIAARTNTPLKTVEARLARARAELRRRLDGDFGGRDVWGAALIALAGLERPARLTSGALLLAAAGVCGVALVAWRMTAETPPPPAAPEELLAAVAPPPAEGIAALAPPARGEGERAAEPGRSAEAEAPAVAADPLLLDLADRRVALVRGRVLGEGLIAPWVAVHFFDQYNDPRPLAAQACGPDGGFALEVPFDGWRTQKGEYQLVAVAEERAPVASRIQLAPGRIVESTLDLTDPGAVAKGLVAESSSAPVPRARIRFWLDDARTPLKVGPYRLAAGRGFALALRDLVADEHGRFEAYGFARAHYRAEILPPPVEGAATLELIDPEGGQRVELPHWTLALEPGLEVLDVEVLGPEGPLEGVAVFFTTGSELESLAESVRRGRYREEELPESTALPRTGRLRVAFDRGQGGMLAFRRVGFAEAVVELAHAHAGPNGPLQVRLEPLPEAPATLVLALQLEGELPGSFDVGLVPLFAGRDWGPPLRSLAAPAGHLLLLTEVPSGSYRVEVAPAVASDVLPASLKVDLAPGEEHTAALELVRGGTLRLAAVGGPASPVGLELVLESPHSWITGERLLCTPVSGRELAAGEKVDLAPHVPPGVFKARLMDAGSLLWKGEAHIEAGKVFDVPLPAR